MKNWFKKNNTKRSKKLTVSDAPIKPVRRKIMRQTLLHVFEFAALLMVVVGVIFGILSWQLSKGPIGLEFLKSDVESALIRVFGG